jgi:chorismate mutase/prephenate dehydratase
VKLIKEKRLRHAAAIASRRAAEIYRMKVLRGNIESGVSNYTRFFILADQDSPPTGTDKTSIGFSLAHRPGSLYQALGGFAKLGINLTKLESRPTRRRPWEYNFYLDFEGHRRSRKCMRALKTLRSYVVSLKILGSYPTAVPSGGRIKTLSP